MRYLHSTLAVLAVVSVVCSGATTAAVLQDGPVAAGVSSEANGTDATNATETTTTTTVTTTADSAATTTATTNSTATTTATTNSTTATPTTATADCRPSDIGPSMQTVQLHIRETEIGPNETGHVTGVIQSGTANECPVKVEITLEFPDEVEADGGQNVRNDGGDLTSEFVLEPGELREINADVRSDDPGQKTVGASVTYFPVGHPDMSKQMNGMTRYFTVTEEPDSKALSDNATAGTTTQPDTGSDGVGVPGFSPVSAVAGLALAVLLLANRNGSDI